MTSKNGSAATSQDHGRVFERFIRDSGRFPDAVNSKASNSDAIDIAASYDKPFGLHTSVKTTGDGWIGLADAIRFYEIDRPYRMIAGTWRQTSEWIKTISTVHELIITLRTLARLRGDLSVDEIREMHETYASFPAGPEGKKQAKKAADRMLRAAQGRTGLVRLDFKGDDSSQRRLQLSVKLETLANAVRDDPTYVYASISASTYVRERSWYHSLALPLEIESQRRRFRDPDAAPQMGMTFLDEAEAGSGHGPTLVRRTVTRQDDAARNRVLAMSDPAQRRLIA